MHNGLEKIAAEKFVFDIGSSSGSFDPSPYPFTTVLVDLNWGDNPPKGRIALRADAAQLPFPDGCAAAVVSNHSLEHFENLEGALGEMARILTPDSFPFVAVPDSSTLSDHLYRWLADGGGHVNPFTDASALGVKIEGYTGLPLFGVQPLLTSYNFLNRKNWPDQHVPDRLRLFFRGREEYLTRMNWVLRLIDKIFRTRLSHYGWALYFGKGFPFPAHYAGARGNVCVRCGCGHLSQQVRPVAKGSYGIFSLIRYYQCVDCGTRNSFVEDGT